MWEREKMEDSVRMRQKYQKGRQRGRQEVGGKKERCNYGKEAEKT